MDIQVKIDRAIKQVWISEVLEDINNGFVLKEDTLKNAFYHHLRVKLGDGYLKRNLIRIYTEYYLDNGQRADIAIGKVKPKKEMSEGYRLKDRIEEVLAIIELKYKNKSCGSEPFFADVTKTRKFIRLKKYQKCQFYLAFIHETFYTNEESSWLSKRQQTSWA